MRTQPLRSLRYSHPEAEAGGDGDGDGDGIGMPGRGGGRGRPSLWVLDSLLLPERREYVEIPDVESTWTAIRTMQVRGAPLIAVVACLGLAVDLNGNECTVRDLDDAVKSGDADAATAASSIRRIVGAKIDYLRTSRPTAVNLFHALDELEVVVDEAIATATASSSARDDEEEVDESEMEGTDGAPSVAGIVRDLVVGVVTEYAEEMLAGDAADDEAIGSRGADLVLRRHRASLSMSASGDDDDDDNAERDGRHGVKVLTMCNAGSLATAGGSGTALGVVRELHRRDRLKSVTALETRPHNHGSRLTAFEIVEDGLPGTLICDSMAATFMKTRGVDAVIVGADRICANGDTASTVGTYQLALIASSHGVPFYVAAPTSTVDVSAESGDDVEIEDRPDAELIETSRAPRSIKCWNPAFDVTPAHLITGIITEAGVIERSTDGRIDVAAFLRRHSNDDVTANGIAEQRRSNGAGVERAEAEKAPLFVPHTYTEQSAETLPRYLAKNAPAAMKALGGGDCSSLDLSCVEIGDGNLNLVFLVTNDINGKQIIVKQALPYVRSEGESWPLPINRSHYEYKALTTEAAACPRYVPEIYHFSKTDGLIAMEYIAPPNTILRKGLIAGKRYPTMAKDVGVFCAHTLFKTSAFKLSATELRKQQGMKSATNLFSCTTSLPIVDKVEFWSSNTEMCALTETVVFTEPYIEAPNNRWTSPQLDADKKAIERDTMLKIAASRLKNKFVTETQALLHADLHSGSVMCSAEAGGSTYVIDPEFGFYGPMGFDTGAFIANLLLNYVSQPGHGNSHDYAKWVLDQVVVFWITFHDEFIRLWNDPLEHIGDNYQRPLLQDTESLQLVQEGFLRKLLRETLGYAGMKMLRRIVGCAHVEDLESIEEKDLRARCERHGLEIAKELIKNARSFQSIASVTIMALDKESLAQALG